MYLIPTISNSDFVPSRRIRETNSHHLFLAVSETISPTLRGRISACPKDGVERIGIGLRCLVPRQSYDQVKWSTICGISWLQNPKLENFRTHTMQELKTERYGFRCAY